MNLSRDDVVGASEVGAEVSGEAATIRVRGAWGGIEVETRYTLARAAPEELAIETTVRRVADSDALSLFGCWCCTPAAVSRPSWSRPPRRSGRRAFVIPVDTNDRTGMTKLLFPADLSVLICPASGARRRSATACCRLLPSTSTRRASARRCASSPSTTRTSAWSAPSASRCERLALMKPGAILVNTARGAVLDDESVAEALRSGRLAAAGLDVFADEPKVPEVYRGLANVVLTPHLGSGTRETRAAMARLLVEEVVRVARGEPPRHRVV